MNAFYLLIPEHQVIVRKMAEETSFSTAFVTDVFRHCNFNEACTREQLYILAFGGPLLDSGYWAKAVVNYETNL